MKAVEALRTIWDNSFSKREDRELFQLIEKELKALEILRKSKVYVVSDENLEIDFLIKDNGNEEFDLVLEVLQ